MFKNYFNPINPESLAFIKSDADAFFNALKDNYYLIFVGVYGAGTYNNLMFIDKKRKVVISFVESKSGIVAVANAIIAQNSVFGYKRDYTLQNNENEIMAGQEMIERMRSALLVKEFINLKDHDGYYSRDCHKKMINALEMDYIKEKINNKVAKSSKNKQNKL